MTLKEKQDIVWEYCGRTSCASCQLKRRGWQHTYDGNDKACLDIAEANGIELDKAVAIIDGKPLSEIDIKDEGELLTRVEKHGLICDEIKDLFKKKNTDYGDSFHQTFLEEGFATSRIRLNDKLERFKRLTRSEEQNVKDESIRDTLIDLANYSIMTILELEDSNHD